MNKDFSFFFFRKPKQYVQAVIERSPTAALCQYCLRLLLARHLGRLARYEISRYNLKKFKERRCQGWTERPQPVDNAFFLCERPWPIEGPHDFVFIKPALKFSRCYCRQQGSTAFHFQSHHATLCSSCPQNFSERSLQLIPFCLSFSPKNWKANSVRVVQWKTKSRGAGTASTKRGEN